jgi:hypothetical protein
MAEAVFSIYFQQFFNITNLNKAEEEEGRGAPLVEYIE